MVFVDSNVPMYVAGRAHPLASRVAEIATFDEGFDAFDGITRIALH